MIKRVISVLLMIAVIVGMNMCASFGGESKAQSVKVNESLKDYSNIDYATVPYAFGKACTSFLNPVDGGLQLVIYNDGNLYIMKYSEDYVLLSERILPLELPLWGSFYNDGEYNYVICGQKRDDSAEDGGEVYRIIKYDRDFNRLASVSAFGSSTDTKTPFNSSNVSVASCGNELTVYTGEIKRSGHQGNIMLRTNTELMDKCVVSRKTMVSHDFRQIVRYDGDEPVFADLSDGSPVRSVLLQTPDGYLPVIRIPGQEGYNQTDAEVSGLEISDTHYFVTGYYYNNNAENVFLASYGKSNDDLTVKWLTNTGYFMGEYCRPHIIKISDDRFVVYWSKMINNLQYVIVDSSGNVLGEVKTIRNSFSSDCEPIFHNGKIIIPAVTNGAVRFEEIVNLEPEGSFAQENPDSDVYWSGEKDTSWYSGDKSEYDITAAEQLAGLAELVNSGVSFKNKKINLLNDLYLNQRPNIGKNEWTPIGSEESPFDGLFNGNGHKIINGYTGSKHEGGLFGYISSDGVVKAVDPVNGVFFSSGSIAYINTGMILYCNNYSYVSDSGAICYRNKGLIYGCKNYGVVGGDEAAGIAIWNIEPATISSCANCGLINARVEESGITICNSGFVYDCYNTGVMSGGHEVSIFGPKAVRLYGIGGNDNQKYNGVALSNCYSSYIDVSREKSLWAKVSLEEASNCYIHNVGTDKWTANDGSFKESDVSPEDIVKKLNGEINTILPGWTSDTEGINNGLPITLADDLARRGIYKVIPEMWGNVPSTIKDNTESLGYFLYFCEEAPEVSVADKRVASLTADVTADRISIKVTPLRTGRTYIVFRFKETENNFEFEYKMPINIEKTGTEPIKSVVGDADGDGSVTAVDAAFIQRAAAGIDIPFDIDMSVADIDGDKKVTVMDASFINKWLVKLKTIYKIGEPIA